MDTERILKLFNSAKTHKDNGEYALSMAEYEEILTITDQLPEVYFNLSFVYFYSELWEKAIDCMKKFLELEPNDTEGKYFLATFYFMNKDYVSGYPYFESRVSKSNALITQQNLSFGKINEIPFWQGEDLTGKTVYLYYEAGLGDTLMYYRYVKMLAQRAKKVYFKPQMTLLPLFAENKEPNVHIIARLHEKYLNESDYQCPIMSLPYYLGLDNQTIFTSPDKFLHASKRETKIYKNKFFNNDKLKIGIKWQGNTLIGAERAMTAESFSKIFELPNSKIYSVQVMGGYDEIQKLQSIFDIVDLGSTFKDFADTAGAIANLDIVICNDTSVGHLAGAMGKKTYIILPIQYDWRWHKDTSKCDWYSNVKLFKQKNTWEEVIERIYEDLKTNHQRIIKH